MPSKKVFTRSIPKKKRRHRCFRNKYSPPQPSESIFKTRNYWKPKITLPVNSILNLSILNYKSQTKAQCNRIKSRLKYNPNRHPQSQ